MSNLAPAEEQLITGNSMASWQISDSPTVGDVITYTITDSNSIPPIPYTVTANDLNPRANIVNPSEATPTFSIALNSALAINNAAAQYGYQAVGSMPADLFSPQYLPPYFAEVILTAPGSGTAFTIGVSTVGTTNVLVNTQAQVTPINAVINNVPVYGYVNLLDTLGMQMAQANLTLWLTKADVVDFRSNEVAARYQLYKTYCEMLSRDMGGKEYVDHFFGGAAGGGVVA